MEHSFRSGESKERVNFVRNAIWQRPRNDVVGRCLFRAGCEINFSVQMTRQLLSHQQGLLPEIAGRSD